MLGDLVYKGKGKLNGFRRLANGNFEQTLAMKDELLGEEFSSTYTAEGRHRPDGTGFVKINGSMTTQDGMTIGYLGIGNGERGEDGSWVYKGAVCYFCAPGRFAKLNGIAVVWEMEVDAGGNFHGRGWEWK